MAGEARRRRLRALVTRAKGGRDLAPYEAAFVHESAVREKLAARSNERLEFLGDAVLGIVVAGWLYERYPDGTEGELALRKSSLVSDAALAATAEELGFDALLVIGHGLAKQPPARRRSVLADAFEAFLGVLFLERGAEVVSAFVKRVHLGPRERELTSIDDPKTLLQEWTQKRYATTPHYEDHFEGPPHERTFTAIVSVGGEALADGSGPSKKRAQRAAAASALEILGRRYDDVGPRPHSKAARTARTRRVTSGRGPTR